MDSVLDTAESGVACLESLNSEYLQRMPGCTSPRSSQNQQPFYVPSPWTGSKEMVTLEVVMSAPLVPPNWQIPRVPRERAAPHWPGPWAWGGAWGRLEGVRTPARALGWVKRVVEIPARRRDAEGWGGISGISDGIDDIA